MKRKDLNVENMRKNWRHNSSLQDENMPKGMSPDDIVISDGDQFADREVLDSGYMVSSVTFDSLDSYLEQVEQMLGGRIEDTYWSSRQSDFTWGEGDYEGTKDILSKGIAPSDACLDVFEELKDIVDGKLGLAVPIERCRSARRERRPAWAGGSINMARYNEMQITGEVKPCFTGLTKRADRPIVRIGLNTSMSCGNKGEDFARISAVASVLCEKLETLGYGVEIYAVDSCRPYNMKGLKYDAKGHRKDGKWDEYWMNTKWLIKSGDDPLDCQAIMSHGMSGLLRCWGFSACYLLHGACNPSSMSCLDTPQEVIEACGLDLMVEKTWSRTNQEENADRVVGMIDELIGTP